MQFALVELHLEPVHVFAHSVETLAQRILVEAEGREFVILLGTLGLPGGERNPCLRHRSVDGVEHRGERREHLLRGILLTPTDDGPARLLVGLNALGLQLTSERLGPQFFGPNAFTRGFNHESRLHLQLPGPLELAGDSVPFTHVEDRPRAGQCSVPRGLRLRLPRGSIRHRRVCHRDRRVHAVGFGLRRLDLPPSAVQFLGTRGELRVEIAQGCKRQSRLSASDVDSGALLGERESRALDERVDLTCSGRRGITIGYELESGDLLPRPAPQHPGAQCVAVARDHRGARSVIERDA